MPYQLLRDHVSRDTVEAFEALLQGSRNGVIVGAAFVVLMKRQRFIVNSCGDLAKNPTLARGMVKSLDDELRSMVEARTDSDTTLG